MNNSFRLYVGKIPEEIGFSLELNRWKTDDLFPLEYRLFLEEIKNRLFPAVIYNRYKLKTGIYPILTGY